MNTDGRDNKLQIKSAGYSDTGSYVCSAANALGEVKKVVKLFVEEIGRASCRERV